VIYLLDTSALLAHYLQEPGGDHVGELTVHPSNSVGISALTQYEFLTTLASKRFDEATRNSALSRYMLMLDRVYPVTEDIARLAAQLRFKSQARIATVDCLIAATAVSVNATLVHRDPHFGSLPAGLPVQLVLPDKLG
jgi:predicted nucleic acid-binding protein